MTGIKGIDADPVTAWFEANIEGVAGPLTFGLIAGGHSSLTYGGHRRRRQPLVLRRPPLGQVLATAHDASRELATISALGHTDIPVPEHLDYYTAFGYWKLAAIIEGVYSRYVAGAMGEAARGFEVFATQVVRLAERAAEAADRMQP